MSKQTDSSLLIVSSVPALYQHILSGVGTYEELATRVLHQIKTAHAFRQVEHVRELARILLQLPIKEYQLIGQYYLVWCKCRELEYHPEILERVAEQTRTYKARALISRGAFEVYQHKVETALYFYTEALRANPAPSEYIAASTGIALAKSMEGFHGSALKDLERIVPLLRYAEPVAYYEAINSYAVELIEHDRLSEAHSTSLAAVSSRFGPFYREWQETFSEVSAKRKVRSTVSISRPESEQALEIESSLDPLQRARIQAAIDFMNANLHRSIALDEVAGMVNISTGYFIQSFKAEMEITPVDYLIGLRLEKAHHLLNTSFLSIKQVMAAVGYNSKSLFARHFRRQFGVSPSEYRKQILRDKLN